MFLKECNKSIRGVAQLGLEYASGGRGVGCSNHLTPTTNNKAFEKSKAFLFCFGIKYNVKHFSIKSILFTNNTIHLLLLF